MAKQFIINVTSSRVRCFGDVNVHLQKNASIYFQSVGEFKHTLSKLLCANSKGNTWRITSVIVGDSYLTFRSTGELPICMTEDEFIHWFKNLK